jgi:alpha-tubulin suppressor-like RCC1 family protein
VSLFALGGHRCGWTRDDNRAYCWGNNSNGQLGNGTTTSSSTPVAVLGPI